MNVFREVKTKTILVALFVSPVLLLSLKAYAEDATVGAGAINQTPALSANSPWSANLTLATRYVSRGFSQTWTSPALQGGVDYADPSGFSAGTFITQVSDKFIQDGTVEWDFYTGYAKSFGDLTLGALLAYWYYPGAGYDAYGSITTGKVKYDYGELIPRISYKDFTAKYYYTYTEDYFGINDTSFGTTGRGNSRGSGYLDLSYNHDLGSGYSLLGHYGHQEVANYEFLNWHDAKIALTKTFDNGWSSTLAVTKGWAKTTDYNGSGNTFTWSRFASTKNASEISDPIATTFVLSVTKVF